jgi:hypothetical protein
MTSIYKMMSRILLLSAIIILFTVTAFSQDEIISPYVTLQYSKTTDNQRILKTILTYSRNRMELPLPGMEISLYSDAGERELLARSTTNEKGVTEFVIPDNMRLTLDSDGAWDFTSEFDGNDTIEAGSSEIAIKDVDLEMELSVIDSIKTVTLSAFTSENGEKTPVAGELVMIYVPRMFSLLPVAEAYLDDNGETSVEFPSDLPGDSVGKLTIIARFDDHPTYGSVEKSITENWGVPTSYAPPDEHRALWTHMPPTWMIFTLLILLAGVWGHYMFAVISLILIHRDAKKRAKEEYRA